MRSLTRRNFLQTSFAIPVFSQLDAARGTFRGNDIVTLGATGIEASRLALGTGFNGYDRSSAQTRQGKQAFDLLLRSGLDKGINFIDMADLYGSHPFVKEVIKGIPRSKLVLLSKVWPRKEKWNNFSGGAKAEVDRFRQELGTDTIDICLMHCMLNDQWPAEFERVRDELSELKQKKVIRAIGVSCHDHGALKVAAGHPWVDVLFARINHIGGPTYAMDVGAEEAAAVLRTARENKKAVIGMKIFGAGKLVKPEEKDASLRFVFRNQLVDAITIGMMNPGEVNDTMGRMARVS
jgi:1-deoxyxylulose-5-phosphate synthase